MLWHNVILKSLIQNSRLWTSIVTAMIFSWSILICSSISLCSLHLPPCVSVWVSFDAVKWNSVDKTLLDSSDGVPDSTVSVMSLTAPTSTASNLNSALDVRWVSHKTSLKTSPLLAGSFLSLQGLLHGEIDGNCQKYFFLPPSKCAEGQRIPASMFCSWLTLLNVFLPKTFVLSNTIMHIFSQG